MVVVVAGVLLGDIFELSISFHERVSERFDLIGIIPTDLTFNVIREDDFISAITSS